MDEMMRYILNNVQDNEKEIGRLTKLLKRQRFFNKLSFGFAAFIFIANAIKQEHIKALHSEVDKLKKEIQEIKYARGD